MSKIKLCAWCRSEPIPDGSYRARCPLTDCPMSERSHQITVWNSPQFRKAVEYFRDHPAFELWRSRE